MPLRRLFIPVALLLAAWAPAWAEPPTVAVPRVTVAPSLDASVGGGLPPGVEITGFRQREPGDGEPASQKTTAYLSYDEDHFYVVFVCQDDPGLVRARLARREAIDDDDAVGLLLDTYGDGRRAYVFTANPLGIQRDGIIAEGQRDDYAYDALWKSEGRLTSDGYVVVFAIPFKSLRFSRAPVQAWRVAVARVLTRANEQSFWPYVTRRIASVGQQMARLEGLEGVSPGRNLQAIPYASLATARELQPDGTRSWEQARSVGLDAKAVVRDAFTVDITVNPDFAQVESDEPQVTVNRRFEVFFPEKRPFFIENAGYFKTPQEAFFSRRIVDPGLGLRVTGRSRGWAIGGLIANDDQPGGDPWTGVGVLRVQREFARQSSLGVIVTDRESGAAYNRVGGIDGRWRVNDTWSVTGQWLGSATRAADGTERTGTSTVLTVERDGRAFDYEGTMLWREPGFRAALGFMPRVDIRQTEHEAGFSWFPAQRGLLRVSTDFEAGAIWDHEGQLQDWSIEPGIEVELPRQTEIGARHWQEMERFADTDFDLHRSGVYVGSDWLSWLGVRIFASWGTGINYYPTEGLRPFLATTRQVEAGLTLRPTGRLRLDETYLFSRLATADGHVPAGRQAGVIFDNHLLRSRATYQFTRTWSARVIVDYAAVLPNEALVSLEDNERLAADVLVTYQANPWTAVYVGYTDAYENVRLSPDPPSRARVTRGGAPTTSVGRQVFVKMSYLLRY